MEKINFENFKPPAISKEILEVLQDNIEKGINGISIYQNDIGTNENISFTDFVNIGDYIEIVYCRRRTDGTSIYKTTGKLKFKTEMEIVLDFIHYTNPNAQTTTTKYVTINSSELNVVGENTNNNGTISASNTIYIVEVKKYN